MKKPLRCHLHLHRWQPASSEDGSFRFRRCRGCGKEDTPDEGNDWYYKTIA